MNDHVNLTTEEAAGRLRTSVSTLKQWRTKGLGPRFLKFGAKVLYPMAEIEAFERSRLHSAVAVQVKENARE